MQIRLLVYLLASQLSGSWSALELARVKLKLAPFTAEQFIEYRL